MSTTRTPQVPASESISPKILYFGTPVALITSLNENGVPNIGPVSSAWALGWTLVLGLETTAKTTANLGRNRECVVNLVSEELHEKVEKLAPLTGNNPIPKHKAEKFRYEPDKFAAVGLTALKSDVVQAPRIGECPIQLEAIVRNFFEIGSQDQRVAAGAMAIEVQVVRVHVAKELILGEHYIDPSRWRPLIYNFRHYYGLGESLGKTFRAEV
jgi:flavin reductase (DIM6/NTAB) family NADH-FMN oxidoreductase RutF